jgi:hypothetical protein
MKDGRAVGQEIAQLFAKPEGSLLCPHWQVTGSYPEPEKFYPHPSSWLSLHFSCYCLCIYALLSQVFSFFDVFRRKCNQF